MNEFLEVMPYLAALPPTLDRFQAGYHAVPVIELTFQALIVVVLVCIFIGFYIGVRINRPRYWD